jgi:hypothetical protein
MDMKRLLEAVTKFSGEKVGQKPGDQWRGSDKAPPGKKLVGDSILKDLSKGKTPKSKEQELAEEYQAFLEAEFKDTVDKRPARKNARPARGHKPQERYKKIKEYGADNTPQIANPEAAKKAIIATNQLKQATGSPAPATNLMKALDAASQGKNIDATNAKILEPTMDIIQKAATDPKLASQFKSLAQQAKTVK